MSHADDPRIQQLESEYNIPEPYTADAPAVQEAAAIDVDVASELEDRVDLRDQYAITIDPDNAKDYDDAIALERDGDQYQAWVHIADVSHYVEEGSAIDESAKNRGVTFYLGDHTRHMLPEALASDVCSLVEDEDRLAHTVEMHLEPGTDGAYEITDFDIYESVVNIDDGLSYSQADAILNQETGEYDEQTRELLTTTDTLTEQLLEDRWEQSLVLNPENSPSDRIIEEMMLKANQAVARHLLEEGKPGIYRVEDHPGQSSFEDIEQDLVEEGYTGHPTGWLTEADNPKVRLNEFMHEEVDEEELDTVRTAIVTKMQPAQYETREGSHYALGFDEYAQFTSPIRRVGDLINHRMVKADPPEDGQEFVDTARTISDVVAQLNLRHEKAKDADRRYDELFNE
ncbi:MAG: RNB domain-containing ribonuclease [Candidatus Nanohaloarchaeota archaeon QJJ-5]|nr:RNB domain-containing ribonuclease [Candidatus Nanohaloarchaeota archaeon QJJ-5]